MLMTFLRLGLFGLVLLKLRLLTPIGSLVVLPRVGVRGRACFMVMGEEGAG